MKGISLFAQKLSRGAGISELMKDLGSALESSQKSGIELSMMGGGNPAHIPELDTLFQRIWNEIGQSKNKLSEILGDYSAPQGSYHFRSILAESLSSRLGYPLTPQHIALTQGSQSAFFLLFNAFGGKFPDGSFKKILLPILPEYIGYADQGIYPNLFTSIPPIVEQTSTNRFRYQPNLSALESRLNQSDIGALCFSRPTNPSGNVISWSSVEKIYNLTQKNDIPLIIDNAYGYPFPNILFKEPEILWKPGMVHVLSLSKLGLPGLRTGIVIADPNIAEMIGEMSAILHLAGGNIGPAMAEKLLEDDLIYEISKNTIQPFYLKRSLEVQEIIDEAFSNRIEYQLHESMGALFLWLHLPNHKKKAKQIYEEAKSKGLFIIPGDWFFPGLEEKFSHNHECIRLTYSRNISEVRLGLKILTQILS